MRWRDAIAYLALAAVAVATVAVFVFVARLAPVCFI